MQLIRNFTAFYGTRRLVLVFLVVSFQLAFTTLIYIHSFSPHSCYMPCLDLIILIILGEEYKS
jgi:ABC-type phosphate transport system permease subunit